MGRLSLASLLALAFWLPVHSASAYTVTLNGYGTSELVTDAWDVIGLPNSDFAYPTALPYAYTALGTDSSAISVAEYNLSTDGFDIAFDHARTATLNSFGRSYGNIYFSVDQNIAYVASGSYTAIDSDGRFSELIGSLVDVTLGSSVFQSTQSSQMTPNTSFTLGLTAGDSSNTSVGSLTGALIAGHDYLFHYQALIQSGPTAASSGATASGSVSLSFVPEPSTGLLLGLGLAGFAICRPRAKP